MPTIKQRVFLKSLNESGNARQALQRAGYGKTVGSSQITSSKGFLTLMARYGLSDSMLIMALRDDIIAKPQNRVAEMTLAFKLKGRLSDNVNPTVPNINLILIKKDGTTETMKYGKHDSADYLPITEGISTQDSKQPVEVQVVTDTQKSRQDSVSSQSFNTAMSS